MDQKLDVEWKYLLFLIFADTACLLGTVDYLKYNALSNWLITLDDNLLSQLYGFAYCV